MPKDPKKNVDRFKVRGGEINEYDFAQNQEKFAEESKWRQNRTKRVATKISKSAKSSGKSRKKAG
jgi:hypothetical protein